MPSRLERRLSAGFSILGERRYSGSKLIEVVFQRCLLVDERLEFFSEPGRPLLELQEGGTLLLQPLEVGEGSLAQRDQLLDGRTMLLDLCFARERLLNPILESNDTRFSGLCLPTNVLETVHACRKALESLANAGGAPIGLLERCVDPGHLVDVRL